MFGRAEAAAAARAGERYSRAGLAPEGHIFFTQAARAPVRQRAEVDGNVCISIFRRYMSVGQTLAAPPSQSSEPVRRRASAFSGR